MHVRMIVAVLALCVGAWFTPAAQATPPACAGRDLVVPVSGAPRAIHGTYCDGDGGRSLFVLVPGATYSHVYWDFPYLPARYSFAQALQRAGFASFSLDRLGSGASSKPPSATVTSQAQAEATHQVIASIRAGGLGRRYGRVLLGGHSLGSLIAVVEAATYHDVDGLLLTGVAHRADATALGRLATIDSYPAPLDAAFPGATDLGYVTTRPRRRYDAFSAPATVDPGVIRADEQTKDVASLTEIADGFARLSSSSAITAPVLLVNGTRDPYFCGALATNCSNAQALWTAERPSFGAAACLSTATVPGAGHAINLHPAAPVYQRTAASWASALDTGRCPEGPTGPPGGG